MFYYHQDAVPSKNTFIILIIIVIHAWHYIIGDSYKPVKRCCLVRSYIDGQRNYRINLVD